MESLIPITPPTNKLAFNHLQSKLLHILHILAYVYELLIKSSLDDFKARWNSHRIRCNKVAGCPEGVPDDLYNIPQLNGMTPLVIILINNNVYALRN